MPLRVKIVLFTNLQHLLRTGNRQDSGKLARVATGGANDHVIMSAGMNNLYALVKKPAAIVSAALSRLRQRPGGSGRGEERGKSVRMTEGRDTPSLVVGVRRLILLKLLFLAPPQQTTGKGLTKEKISIKILASVMS